MFSFFQGSNIAFSKSVFSFFVDSFNNYNYCLLLVVLVFVFFVLFFLALSWNFFKMDGFEYQMSEFLCSVFPVLILLFQVGPSLFLLYFFGFIDYFSDLCLKIVGHQWYWSYSYGDFLGLDFDSYCKFSDTLVLGDFRLLDVDNRCVVPVDTVIFFCISSGDVIHSWTLFNMSLKLDAMSGVLSTFYFSFPMVGVYYGQCSEICGANHSFMPVVLETTPFSFFKFWCFLF